MSSTESKAIVNSSKDELDSTASALKKKVAPRSRYSARDSQEDSLESESLLLRKQRVQCIPMSSIQSPLESVHASSPSISLQNHSSKSIGNTSLSLNDSPDLQSIQPVNSRANVSDKLRAAQSSTSISSTVKICSPQFCCGADPVRITFIVLTVVTMWSIIIFCINLQKQVSLHSEDLGTLQHEILKLEHQNLELRKENGLINSVLGKIAASALRSRTRKKSSLTGPSAKPKRNKNGGEQRKKAPKNQICTESGQNCIFPFVYKDVVHRSCVKEWSYPRPWCATKVDGDGRYISGDSSGWSECLDSCP